MNTPIRLVLGVVATLLLVSCKVTSDNPLSAVDSSQADPRLTGDWRSKKNYDTFRFTSGNGAWMHVDIVPEQLNGKPESYDFYPTVIGSHGFLNVIDTNDQGTSNLYLCPL